MSDLGSLLILAVALSVIPISILAYIGIESILDSSLAKHEKFYAWWDHEKSSRSPEEFRKLLSGASYRLDVTIAITDPDRSYYKRKKKRLESKLLRRLLVVLLSLIGLTLFRMVLSNLPVLY